MAGLTRDDIDAVYPLAPAQAGMLFHHLAAEDRAVYLVQDRYRLSGPLDRELFRTAWQRVVDRHDVLRTALVWQGLDEPLQAVRARLRVPWEELDLRALPGEEQQEHVAEFLRRQRAAGLDLATQAPVSATLVRLDEESHELLWLSHHIVLDGWSAAIVLREVLSCYRELLGETVAELAPPVPYLRYVDWLATRDRSAEEAYWRAELAGFSAPTSLRAPRPGCAGGAPGVVPIALPAGESARVRRFAREHALAVSTVLEGAWALVLSAFSGEHDVVYGAVRSGRSLDLADAEAVVGMLVTTLPARVAVDPAASAGEWLPQLQRRLLGQREFEYSSLTDIQGWSEIPHPSPMFETLFSVQALPRLTDEDLPPGLVVEKVRTAADPDYPVTVIVDPGDAIGGELLYQPDAVDRETAEQLAATYVRLLTQLVRSPDTPVGMLNLVSDVDGERRAARQARDAAAREYPPIHELLAEQIRRTPDGVAVAWDDGRLTYREFDELADSWAGELLARGVGPDVPVGLCFERSAELVVAILAVVRAGGAYVPLEPLHPRQRHHRILSDTGARLVLAAPPFAGELAGHGATVLPLTLSTVPPARDRRPQLAAHAESVAYVLCTSGSTGTPKAVAVPRRALSWFVAANADILDLGPGDVVGMASSPGFDAMTFEYWTALTRGATLQVIPQDVLLSPTRLRAYLADKRVGVLCLNAALLEELARHAPDFAGGVRVLLFGGQVADPAAVAQVREASAPEHLIQVYGPSETTVWVCVHRVEPGSREHIPLGPPRPHALVHLLDRELRPVPPGMPGELYLGGGGIGCGYHGNPALTAERFVPDPFGRGRLYRTGDLARYRMDGRLEFIGRVDDQVKLRGFRVEPGEIATRLRAHPHVGTAVVVPRYTERNDGYLEAYVVPAAGTGPDEDELRRFVAETLPAYMVPARFVILDELPLTASGKIDRTRLAPASPDNRPATDRPSSPEEQAIAAIWARFLERPDVGPDDNFFHLGGHSLLAIPVVAAIAEELRAGVTVRTLFDAPTVRELAAVVAARGGALPRADTVPEASAGVPVPLSSGQRRLWLLHRMNPGSAEYNSPVLLRVRGPLDQHAFASALEDVVGRHEVLRSRIEVADDGEPVLVSTDEPVPADVRDLSGLPPADRERRAMEHLAAEAARPFDLAAAPLLRYSIARLGPDDHLVLVTFHHIAVDGVSVRIIASELAGHYACHVRGEPGTTTPPHRTHRDFAVWDHAEQDAGVHDGQLAFWRERLRDLPAVALPTDRPRPPVRSGRGRTLNFVVPADQVAALTTVGITAGATRFMTFLAAFAVLLRHHTGQDDLAVGTPVDLRRPELSEVVGFLVNTVVLRLDLGDDPTFTELLGRVRSSTLDAYEHSRVPFDHVVEELNPVRDAGRNPLFDVLYQLTPDPVGWDIDGLDVTRVRLPRYTSNVDLGLELTGRTDGGLDGEVEYNADLFEPATVERLVERFLRLIEGVCAAPHHPATALDVLTDADREELAALDRTGPAGSPPVALHRAVADHARTTPTAPAVARGAAVLGYEELDDRANQLARYLAERGARRGDVIGLLGERSPDTVVAILAILKVGAAYLPLRPDDPPAHLAGLLHDQSCPMLVTTTGAGRVPADFRGTTVDPHRDADSIAARPTSNVDAPTGDRDLAYVIHTSGSTSRPKAVGVEHGSVSRYAAAAVDSYRLSPADRILQFSAFAFDAFVSELWTTLSTGATLLFPEDRVMAPDALLATIADTGTTVIDMPTAYWHLLCAWLDENPEATVPAALRLVVIGGEQAGARHLAQWWSTLGDRVQVTNSYGQTETACVITHADLTAADACHDGTGEVPVGRPLPGTRLHVLDPALRQVPPGVVGELYVAGEQVGRGYLGAPARTAERFLPDPWGTPGARLHRTGDLARLTPTGQLVILGRTDDQVKVRGFRIELGEAERVLALFPGIRSVAVDVRTHPEAGPALVGYVVPAGEPVEPREILAFLRQRLPGHLVPDVVVSLPELPITRNGKVDRAALPEPAHAPAPEPEVPVLTTAERSLAAVWTSVLPVTVVAPGDRFFDLGGHSLALARVATRIRGQFGVDVPLSVLYERPTLAEHATLVEDLLRADIEAMSDVEVRAALASEE